MTIHDVSTRNSIFSKIKNYWPKSAPFFALFLRVFHEKCATWPWICRKLLIRSALESSNTGASNKVPNFIIQPFEADLVTLDLMEPESRKVNLIGKKHWNSKLFTNHSLSETMKAAPNGWFKNFDPSLGTPGLGLSNARKFKFLRQLRDQNSNTALMLLKNRPHANQPFCSFILVKGTCTV